MSLRSDVVRFLVLGFRSDLRIELQAPVLHVTTMAISPFALINCHYFYNFGKSMTEFRVLHENAQLSIYHENLGEN